MRRLTTALLIFAATQISFLKAETREYPDVIFSFDVTSSSRIMNGTRGTVRAIYSDPAYTNFVGIDYCHNHEDMYPDVNATKFTCYKTITLREMKSGASVIKIPQAGTALFVKALDPAPDGSGRIELVLGETIKSFGRNQYRKIEIEFVKARPYGLLASFDGSVFRRLSLKGWVDGLNGGLSAIALHKKSNEAPFYNRKSIDLARGAL